MKTRTLVSILIIALAVQTFAGSCATRRKIISDEDFMEAWSGAWINTDYGKRKNPQKKVYYSDGRWEDYYSVDNLIAIDWGKTTIIEKRLDSKGNVWYRTHFESLGTGATGYTMGKISNSGNTLEVIWASESYPIEEWEPDRFEYNYQIHYRQE